MGPSKEHPLLQLSHLLCYAIQRATFKSVGPSHTWIYAFSASEPQLLLKCFIGLLRRCPWPLAHDYGCRVSGLVSRVLRDSTLRYVGPSVGWSVCPFLFFGVFEFFQACCSSPVPQMTFSSTAPAHPHATGVAVYPALFFCKPGVCSF